LCNGVRVGPSRRLGRRKPSLGGPSLGLGHVLWRGKASLRFVVLSFSSPPKQAVQQVKVVLKRQNGTDNSRISSGEAGRTREVSSQDQSNECSTSKYGIEVVN